MPNLDDLFAAVGRSPFAGVSRWLPVNFDIWRTRGSRKRFRGHATGTRRASKRWQADPDAGASGFCCATRHSHLLPGMPRKVVRYSERQSANYRRAGPRGGSLPSTAFRELFNPSGRWRYLAESGDSARIDYLQIVTDKSIVPKSPAGKFIHGEASLHMGFANRRVHECDQWIPHKTSCASRGK